MTIWVTLKSRVPAEKYEDLIPFLEANLPNVRGFKGTLSVSILHDQQTGNFLIFEEWLSREHHQNYIKFISENGVMEQLVSFLEGPPEVTYLEKLAI